MMPAGFGNAWWRLRGFGAPDAWIPAMMAPLGMAAGPWRETPRAIESPNVIAWWGIGRVDPAYGLSDARAEAAVLGERARTRWPMLGDEFPVTFDVVPMREEAADPDILRAVVLLELAGALVLLLGSVNLGNLFFARGLERARAHSLHTALGAPRAMLIWGLSVEALLVGAAGGLAGVLLTRGALAGLGFAEPTVLTAPFGVALDTAAWRHDGSLVLASVAACLAAATIASVAAAWRTTRPSLSALLGSGSGVTGGGLRRLGLARARGLLVVLETAAALAVMLPALLLVRSLDALVTADLGFRAAGVTAADVRHPDASRDASAAVAFADEVASGLRRIAGIEDAAWVSCLPVECGSLTSMLLSEEIADEGPVASVHVVSPASFRTLGIPVRRGRDFSHAEAADGPRVAILSERAARLLRIEAPGPSVNVAAFGGGSREVVGIVGDVPYRDLASAPMPAVYLPLAQEPRTEGFLIVRASDGLGDVPGLLRQTIAALAPSLEAPYIEALPARVERSVARFRGAAWLLGVAAALALFLCAVGIYGLLWSLVAQSRREIAVRIAVGAAPAVIARSLAGSALQLAAVGLPAGAALGVWGAHYLDSYLFGVGPWDGRALLALLGVTAGLALLAALRPALRASRTDPVVVLRSE